MNPISTPPDLLPPSALDGWSEQGGRFGPYGGRFVPRR
jgi:hypothetical protein